MSQGEILWQGVDNKSHPNNNTENTQMTLWLRNSTTTQVSNKGSQVTTPITADLRSKRRQHHERQHHQHGLSGSMYISPTTASGVRTDSSIISDRTIQPSMQPQQLISIPPSHTHMRLMGMMCQLAIQDLLHGPISSSYLSFHIQGRPGPSDDHESGR